MFLNSPIKLYINSISIRFNKSISIAEENGFVWSLEWERVGSREFWDIHKRRVSKSVGHMCASQKINREGRWVAIGMTRNVSALSAMQCSAIGIWATTTYGTLPDPIHLTSTDFSTRLPTDAPRTFFSPTYGGLRTHYNLWEMRCQKAAFPPDDTWTYSRFKGSRSNESGVDLERGRSADDIQTSLAWIQVYPLALIISPNTSEQTTERKEDRKGLSRTSRNTYDKDLLDCGT